MLTVSQNTFYAQQLDAGMDYETYRKLIDELLADNKTTGVDHSPSMLEYTRLNIQRMNRVHKTFTLQPELQATLDGLNHPYIMLTITEGWCGDASQIIPVLQEIAEATPQLTLSMVLRDKHPELMEKHLTNGSKSIPMVVVLDGISKDPLAVWGPRPAPAQNLVMEYKLIKSHDEWVKDLYLWYAKDRAVSIQQEWSDLLSRLEKERLQKG